MTAAYAVNHGDLADLDAALEALHSYGTHNRATCKFCKAPVKAGEHNGGCPLGRLARVKHGMLLALMRAGETETLDQGQIESGQILAADGYNTDGRTDPIYGFVVWYDTGTDDYCVATNHPREHGRNVARFRHWAPLASLCGPLGRETMWRRLDNVPEWVDALIIARHN